MKRREFLKSMTAVAGSMVAAPAVWSPAKAQSRQETLLLVSESGPNNLDIHGVGTIVPGYETSWNCYDRLLTHEKKTLADGSDYYDRDKIVPELAEDFSVGDMSITFKLRKDAVFHDGTPITAHDAKWSFDRAVLVGGFPTFQMKAGSLEKPEQFVAVDDHTFRVDFIRKDNLTIPDLAVIVPCVMNSKLVKSKATASDPWGLDYVKTNVAGGGAYRMVSWQPGSELIYERNDAWKSGPMPKIRRIVWRMVPSAGNRRALLERGDADISFDLPPKDFAEMKQQARLKIVSTPISNGIQYIGMNVKKPPFDNPKVRQAVACAIPYRKIMDAVMFGQAKPMFGAPHDAATTVSWPQPHSYDTDLDKARALMAEAGLAGGFETTLSFDLGFAVVNEPLCVLLQEKSWADRHQDHDQQDPRRQLAQRADQEGAAADRQRVFRLARLSGIFLLLDLPWPERRVQYHELPEQGDGRADRQRARRRRQRRPGDLRQGREGFRRQGFRRPAAHPALPALSQRRHAEEHLRLSLLVPPAARLSHAGEGVAHVGEP